MSEKVPKIDAGNVKWNWVGFVLSTKDWLIGISYYEMPNNQLNITLKNVFNESIAEENIILMATYVLLRENCKIKKKQIQFLKEIGLFDE